MKSQSLQPFFTRLRMLPLSGQVPSAYVVEPSSSCVTCCLLLASEITSTCLRAKHECGSKRNQETRTLGFELCRKAGSTAISSLALRGAPSPVAPPPPALELLGFVCGLLVCFKLFVGCVNGWSSCASALGRGRTERHTAAGPRRAPRRQRCRGLVKPEQLAELGRIFVGPVAHATDVVRGVVSGGDPRVGGDESFRGHASKKLLPDHVDPFGARPVSADDAAPDLVVGEHVDARPQAAWRNKFQRQGRGPCFRLVHRRELPWCKVADGVVDVAVLVDVHAAVGRRRRVGDDRARVREVIVRGWVIRSVVQEEVRELVHFGNGAAVDVASDAVHQAADGQRDDLRCCDGRTQQ
mmetsp:Transcript_17595/g.54561  ORF Transcript_17595/g.54561 Transcript_17595/m.54561 type:complete len:353 (-) Transcript_17595:5349-6407(-)